MIVITAASMNIMKKIAEIVIRASFWHCFINNESDQKVFMYPSAPPFIFTRGNGKFGTGRSRN